MPTLIATAETHQAADLICGRLHRAGIEAVARPDVLGVGIGGGELDIYVEDEHAERAREILRGEGEAEA